MTDQNSPNLVTDTPTPQPDTQQAPAEVTSDSDTDSDPGTDFGFDTDNDTDSDTNTDYDTDSETDEQNTFASPKDWGDRRDTAYPAKQSTERFDPDNSGRTGNGQLSGKITQIRYDLRRFEVSPGQWVREFTVPIKLVSNNGSVTPEAIKQLGDKVSQSVNTNYNQQYHLPGGDQLHITVEFDPDGVPVEVIDSTVDKGRPETNQAQWDVRDDPDGLTHEVMHFLGLGEGYADPDMLFNRQDQPGIMGKDAWNGATFLTDQNLGKIDEVAQTAGPVRDHGLGDQSPPPTDRPTGNPSPDFGPDSLHTPSKAPAVTLTTAQVNAALPDYMVNSKGLGPSKQLRPTNNADIRPGLIALHPQLRGNPALDIIQGQIDTNAGSFLGKGRPFTIKVGKRSMELTVRATFDWTGMTVDNTATDTEKAKPSGKDTRKSENSATDSRNTDLNLSAFMSAAPPLVISAGVQVPTGINSTHDTKTSTEVGSSSNVEVDGMRQVKAPITFTYALVDSNNHQVGPVDPSGQPVVHSVTGDVDLSVPTTFTQPGATPLKTLTQAPPTKFGVEEAVSTTPDGDFFQQVAAGLPAHLKEIGAPGRSVLQNFLSDANIKTKLPAMAVYDGAANPDKGWVRSDPLIKNSNSKKWSSKGNAVEMRAVARQVRVIETVDGVKNTDTDSYKNVTSEKNSAKHNVGGNLMIGGGADVGAVFFAVGPTVSLSRESEKSQEHTQTNVSKNSAERTGEAVRYHTVFDIEVRTVGHPAQTLAGQVDAHLWATKDRADNAQIGPNPTPAPVARQDGARTHYAPSHIEHGQSLGGSVIDDFSGGDKLYRSIVDVLQNVPGRKGYYLSSDKFVQQFDNADFASGLSSSVNDILSRDDKVRTSLSDQQLSHLIDTMLTGPGLTIPLVKNGTFHDYHTNITLRAQLNSVGDLELLSSPQNNGPSGDKTVGTSKTKEKTGTAFADNKTKNLSVGIQGRAAGGIGKASGTALATVKGGKIWTNSTKVGSDSKSSINRTHGDTLGVDGDLGSREFRQFTGNLTITPQVSSYVRLNVNTRRISFGSHGRSVPALVPANRTPGAGQPAPQNIPLRLLVPEILVTTVPPAQVAAITTVPQPIANPTTISQLGNGLSRNLDGIEVVTFLGAEHLQTSAKGQLRDASGDPIFEFADGDNSTRIGDRLSPESLKSDPRLFSRPVVVDGLHYGRRAADVDGQVAVLLTPVNPQVVSAAEYQKIKQIQAGGSSVGKSKGSTSSIEATVTGVAAMSGPATSTVGNVKNNAFGVFIASVTPWGKSWGTNNSGDLKSAEKTTFENGPVKKTLVRVNIDAEVVAETRKKGNIDKFGLIRGQDLNRSGERFSMPGSVLMWVTDSQLAELRNTPQPAAAAVVHPPNRTLPPPVSMGQNQVSSLGIGGVTSTIDLTGSIANLHTALVTNMGQDAANRLLPASSLDTNHDNHRELNRFLSDVNRSVNNTLNGGKITPLRLEDKWSGRTYYVTLDARVTAAPTFTGIDHVDKLSTEDSVTVSTTKEKTSSRTIGGFFASIRPSVRMVEKTDPLPAGQEAPKTGHGPASGTISGGLSADGSASTKSTKDTSTPKTDYKQSASTSGPVGSYTAPMDFDIRIERRLDVDAHGNERANQVVATHTAQVADVKIQKLAVESLPAPTGGAARHGVAGPINSVAARGDAPTNTWRQAPGHGTLPDTGTFSVEHFFGDMTDVRKAAEQAITESGVTVDTATIAALKAGITPAAFKAGLPAMVNGEFVLPLPGNLGRDLEIHARLGADPRLGSVSAGVEIDGSVKKSAEDKTERKTGPTLSVTGIVPNAGGGVSHPSGASELGERRPFGGVFAGTQNDYKLGGKAKQVELKAGIPANTTTSPQSATAIKTDDKITQAMLHNVEFRFVARPKSGQTTERTGITTMNVNDGYVVRTRPDTANPLPDSMTAAATTLNDAGKTWSDAVKTLNGLDNQSVRPDTTAAQTAVANAETAWWQARDTYNQELTSARLTQAERDQIEADRQAREAADQLRRDNAARAAQAERDRQAQEAKDKAEADKRAADEKQRREDEAKAERDRQAKAEEERQAAEDKRREDEARAEREREAKAEQERQAKAEQERQAKAKQEREAKAEQERQAQAEQERQAKAEQERQAKAEQEREAKAEQERQAKAEQEREAKAEQERQVKAEQEREAKAEQERQAKAEQERQAKAEQEREAKAEQERQAKAEQERQAKAEQERQAKAEREREAKAEQERQAKAEQEREAKAQQEREAKAERERQAQAEQKAADDKLAAEQAEQEAAEKPTTEDKATPERETADPEQTADKKTTEQDLDERSTPEETVPERADSDVSTQDVTEDPAVQEAAPTDTDEQDEDSETDSEPEDDPVRDQGPKRDDDADQGGGVNQDTTPDTSGHDDTDQGGHEERRDDSGGDKAPADTRTTDDDQAVTVERVVAELHAATVANPVEPRPLLGPDLFGLLSPKSPPPFLAGVDISTMDTAKLPALFAELDLTRPAPERIDPESLLVDNDFVTTVERSEDSRDAWASGDVKPLPARLEMPALLQTIWLGGPVTGTGSTAVVQRNFGAAAAGNPGTSVLWTDIPRTAFDAAREAAPTPEGTPDPHAAVREMVSWAQTHDVRLLNLDEVFHDGSPMRMDAYFRSESAKQVGRGWAAASDIARVELLRAFGGTYTDGDNVVNDPRAGETVVRTPEAWAMLTTSSDKIGNSAYSMPRNHPVSDLMLDLMAESFAKPQRALYSSFTETLNKEFFDTPQMRSRRHSLMIRTGPDLLYRLFPLLGYQKLDQLPISPGVTAYSAGSWMKETSNPRPVVTDLASTVDLARNVTQTLVRDLHNRGGDLHLTAVSSVVDRHADPDLVWSAVLDYLAAHPEVADQVRTATTSRWEGGRAQDVVLPPTTADTLVVSPDGERSRLGETTRPAMLVSPGTSRTFDLDVDTGTGKLTATSEAELDWLGNTVRELTANRRDAGLPEPVLVVVGEGPATDTVLPQVYGRFHGPSNENAPVIALRSPEQASGDSVRVELAWDLGPQDQVVTYEDWTGLDEQSNVDEDLDEGPVDRSPEDEAPPVRTIAPDTSMDESDDESDDGLWAVPPRQETTRPAQETSEESDYDSDSDDDDLWAVRPQVAAEPAPVTTDAAPTTEDTQNFPRPESPVNDDLPGDLGPGESFEMQDFSDPSLGDVDFVPLHNSAGEVIGVGFPRAGESQVLLTAFENDAGDKDTFSVAVHHGQDGFSVTRKDGTEVRLTERGVIRLMASAAGNWQQNSSLVFLSCDVTSTELGTLTNLVREQGYEGQVRGPDGRVEISASGDVRVLDGGAFRDADGTRQERDGEFDDSGGTIVFTNLTPAQVLNTMSDYLRTSKGLGPSKQLRMTNGADIRPEVTATMPALAGNKDLDIVQGQIASNIGSFLGHPRAFPITVGKQTMELRVLAEFDWTGMTVDNTVTDTEKAKPSGKDVRKSENSASDARNTDLNVSAFMSAVPPLVISAGLQIPTGINSTHETKLSKEAGSSSDVEIDGMRQVKAPVRLTFELVDPQGRTVLRPAGSPAVRPARGDVDLHVPTTFARPTAPLTNLTQAPPSKFGVEEAVSTTTQTFFDQVAATLPAHLREIGAPGRSVLQNFLSDANIKTKLPAMAVYDGAANPDKGWVRSDPLIKSSKSTKWTSKGNAVEMRAVARQVRVIETVDGVKNTDTDSYKNTTSEKNSAKHNVGGNLMIGGGADAKAVFFAVGPTASWSRESEKSQEHTQTTVTKNAAERTGQAVRYQTVFDIEVRTVGHAARTLDGHVDAHLWATKDRADNAQLGPNPAPAPVGRQGTARTHYAPAHIEHSQSLGGSVIDDFSGGDKLYRSIVDVLRNVPGRKGYYLSSDKFIRQFDDPDFARGLSGSINDILTRDDKVRTALSDQQLSHLIDTMLTGPGLTIPLVKKGTFHDYHTNITLRARLNGVGDLELLSSPQNSGPAAATNKTAGSSKTREKTGTAFADTTTKSLTVGVQARVAGGLGKASGTWLGAVKGGKIWTKSTTVGSDGKTSVKRTHGDTVDVDGGLGSREFRQFSGNLTITPSIASYVRLNVNTRRISLGSYGKSTPTPVRTTRTTTAVVQPAAQVIPLRLLVPEVLVTTTRPAQIVIAAPVARPLGPLPRISQLGNGRSRLFDGAEVVSFLGSEHLQSAAKAELTNSSGDPIFQFADGNNSTRITDRLSPESLTSDPRLFSRPIVVDGLHYGRRAADVDGQVAVALTPVNPQPVSRTEYQKIKNIMAGGSSVGKTKGNTYSAETSFTGVAGASAHVTSTTNGNKANAFGVFIAAVTPWSKSWGTNKGGDLKSVEKVTFENGPVKKSLVRVNVNAEVVAETRVKGNIDKFGLLPDKDLNRTGQQFTLPGSVLMWVTDAQLAALRNTPAPAPVAAAPTRTLPPPTSMGQNKVSSLGIGGMTTTIDLTDRIPHLYRRLATNLGEANAARLLPKSSLDTKHDNHRELTRFLSDVNRAANNTLNGGKITPLRLEDKWSGRTYYVTVEAEFTGDLEFTGIDHVEKLAVEDSISLSTKKETSRSRTIGGLFASLRPSARISASSEPLKLGEVAPTTGNGPPSGTISGGLSVDGALSTKSTKDITAPQTDYKQSASISGPVGSFSGRLNFEIKIERRIGIDAAGNEHADQVVATDKSSFRDVIIQKLAEESLPAPTGNAARHGIAGPITDPALRGDTAITTWRQAPGRVALPDSGTFAVEHFFGDMKDIRKAAERAITRSGVTVDTATIAALKAGITPAAFKAGLPAMVDGKFVIPLPGDLGRDLEIHARLRDQPRLGSVSAGVEIDGSVKQSNETKSERKTGPTLSATGIAPNAGGGTSHPDGRSDIGDRRAFGAIFAGTQNDYKLGDKNKQVELKAGAPATTTTSPQSATAIKTDDKITQAMLHNVEFLFVARPKAGQTTTNTGVTARTINDGYVVRRRPDPAHPLPATMTTAATALTDAGKTWSDAVKTLEGLRQQQPVPSISAAAAAVTAAETAWWQARDTYNQELTNARMTQAERDARDRAERARLARLAKQRRVAREAQQRVDAERRAAAEKLAADKKIADDKAAADKAAADKAAADKAAADKKAAGDKAAADKLAEEKKAAEDKAAADKLAAEEKAAADKAAADKAEREAAEKLAAEQKAAEEQAKRVAAEREAAETAAAERAEREEAQRKAAEQKAAEEQAKKLAAERAEKEAAELAEREAAEKAAAEKAQREAAEKAAAELAKREAAEKAAAEQAEKEAAEQRALKAAAEQAERQAELKVAEELARKAAAEQAEKEAAEKAEAERAATQERDAETHPPEAEEEETTDEESDTEQGDAPKKDKRDDKDDDGPAQGDHTGTQQPEEQQERQRQNFAEPENPTNDDLPGDLGATEAVESIEMVDFSGPSLDDIDFVPLHNAAGDVIGVGFPRAGESEILLTAFENNAGQDNEFAVAVHHDADGFAVTRRDGTEVRLDQRAVVRLMTSADNGWQRSSSLVFLSCDVTSTELGSLTNLVREQGFEGRVRGPDGRVEISATGDVRVLDGGSFRDSEGTRQPDSGTFNPEGGTVVFAPRPNLTDEYRTVQPGGVTTFESVRPLRITDVGGDFPAFSTAAAGFETHIHPTLRTTDDGSMAINGTNSVNGVEATQEHREFFATPEVIAAAQETLRRLNSGVELDVQPAAVELDGVVLQRVTPRPLNPAQDVCRDFSTQIHGANPDALLFRDLEGNIVQAPVRTQDGVEITGAYHLADGLATLVEQGTPNPDAATAAEFVARDTRPGGGMPGRPLPGVRYGAMLNPSNDTSGMDVVAERTGVNQHAWARPGEMYVMSSIPGETADGEADFDVNASRDTGVSGHWGYHFATVIAESADGRSQITLENYARRGQIDRAVRESVERNLAHHAGDLTRIVAELDQRIARNPDEATELGRRRAFAAALAEIEATGFDGATPQVRQRVRRAAVADLKLPPLGRQWHFKMYTKNPGESFFEQHALTYEPGGTSAGVNPLVTVAIGGMRTTGSLAVEFERGRRDLERGELGGVREVARKVARAAIWRRDNGMPLPSVVATGYGNGGRLGPMRARATGLARARTVEAAFRAELAAELTRLQGDRVVVRPEDIQVRPVAANPPPLSLRGDGDPSLRRATLDVVFTENSVPLPEAPTEGEIGIPDTQQHEGSVLDDRTWLHSKASTADWMVDPNPAATAAIDAVRGNVKPMTVSIEDTGVVRGTITTGGERPRIELEHWRHPIAYDLRRMEVAPGKWVQEYTVRLGFKNATPEEVQALVTRAQSGIDRFYNDPGYRLPSGDQLRVRLEQGTLPHATIDVRPEGSPVDQLSWTPNAHEAVLAHEFGHFLGFYDEYTRPDGHGGAWVFRGGGRAAGGRIAADRVVQDDGLFTAHLHAYVSDTTGTVAEPTLKPRNLWLLETRTTAIGSNVVPAHLDTEVPGDDDDAFPLLLELWSDAAPASENADPDEDVLGQDLFGMRKIPPAPAFRPDQLDRLAEPKLVHAVSLGTVELPASHDGWLTVLWTDVPRSQIRVEPPENVVVISIDEVFNAESPMSLQSFFAAEMAKPGGRPEEILRLEILRRFGGVSVEGDLHDLDLSQVDLTQPWSHDSADNDVFAMPKDHPVTTVLLDQLRDGYRRPDPLPVAPDVDDLSTTELTKRIIQTLMRGLKVRHGDLHLNAVAAVLAGHSKAGVVWTAVLTFLASRPELAAQVNSVTWHHYGIADELAILRKILMSRAAHQLVNISPVSPPQPFPAELTQLASLNWPDWL